MSFLKLRLQIHDSELCNRKVLTVGNINNQEGI